MFGSFVQRISIRSFAQRFEVFLTSKMKHFIVALLFVGCAVSFSSAFIISFEQRKYFNGEFPCLLPPKNTDFILCSAIDSKIMNIIFCIRNPNQSTSAFINSAPITYTIQQFGQQRRCCKCHRNL